MSMADWTAAVRLAARTPAGRPDCIGGHSTGATLTLLHTLTALKRPGAPSARPRAAPLAGHRAHACGRAGRADRCAGRAAGAGVRQGALAGNGARVRPLQVQLVSGHRLTPGGPRHPGAGPALAAGGRLAAVGRRFHGGRPRCRERAVRPVAEPGAPVGDVRRQPPADAAERDAAPGSLETVRRSALDWTSGLVSPGHVALPFPPGDPIYGFIAGSGQAGLPSIGSLLLRG